MIRRTLRFTYGTRIAISILIPLGGYLDVICGLLSMQISGFMIGDVALDSLGDGGLGFLPALVLTLTQGLVMNGVLAVYGGLILGINGIVAVLRK